jgi:hypothetical protein
MKICSKCKIEKDKSEFVKNKHTKDGLDSKCKICFYEQKKNYRLKNREKTLEYKKNYRLKNNDKILEKAKDYYQNNKDDIKEYHKDYYNKNKDEINKKVNIYHKNRLKTDPIFKLRNNISQIIYQSLKKQNSSKSGESIFNYLQYTIEDLKQHLESQFEDWMNWDNWGRANVNEKTWNIDHIIPQSALPFSSMKDINFRKCWNLQNLRPMEAIANIKKSNKTN